MIKNAGMVISKNHGKFIFAPSSAREDEYVISAMLPLLVTIESVIHKLAIIVYPAITSQNFERFGLSSPILIK